MDKNYFRDTKVGYVDIDISNLLKNETPMNKEFDVHDIKGKIIKKTKISLSISCL